MRARLPALTELLSVRSSGTASSGGNKGVRYTQRTREPYEEHPRLLTVALPLLDTGNKGTFGGSCSTETQRDTQRGSSMFYCWLYYSSALCRFVIAYKTVLFSPRLNFVDTARLAKLDGRMLDVCCWAHVGEARGAGREGCTLRQRRHHVRG